MNHEPAINDLDLATAMYTEAIAANLDELENRDAVLAAVDKMLDEAFGTGDIVVSLKEVRTLKKQMLKQQVGQRAGQRTTKMLRDLAGGQLPIEGIDDVIDLPLKAGKGRFTTVRHLNEVDVDRMYQERRDNADKQLASLAQFDEFVPTIRAWLREHGSIPAAIAAGAVPLAAAQIAG